ncbi:MAG TPA: serine hydrolase, partial [Bacillota bacterium]|nr:serine hydrolase [Bacillota bacterium]
GMQWTDAIQPTDSDKMSHSTNWAQYVLERPMIDEPGRVFNYNSGGSQLLSEIIQKATGKSAYDYATEHIFKPLGITNVKWWQDQQGHSIAGWGLHLATYDITKIGYLFLREGRWREQQLIPRQWVKEATQNHITVESGFGRGSGYGYQWWIYTDLPYSAYKAWGSLRKHSVMMIIIPDLDMVVTLAGENGADKQILKSFIIPAVKSSRSIKPNPAAVKELKQIIDQSCFGNGN